MKFQIILQSLILLVGVSSADADDRANIPEAAPNNLCGVNCLYVFLSSLNVSVNHDEFVKAVPRREEGTSLLELQQTAERYGVDTKVYQCDVADLGTTIPLPAVVLFRSPDGHTGHYGTVYQVGPGKKGMVCWIEGTVGYDFARSKAVFEKYYWSGYALARPVSQRIPRLLLIISLLHMAIWGGGIVYVRRFTKQKLPVDATTMGESVCSA